jgi:hypothetical protein
MVGADARSDRFRPGAFIASCHRLKKQGRFWELGVIRRHHGSLEAKSGD